MKIRFFSALVLLLLICGNGGAQVSRVTGKRAAKDTASAPPAKEGTGTTVPPIQRVPVADYVTNWLQSRGIMTTNGATELFYDLNPGLQGQESVQGNYPARYPGFPNFYRVKKTFNKRFKKDKRSDGPYISFKSAGASEGYFQTVCLNENTDAIRFIVGANPADQYSTIAVIPDKLSWAGAVKKFVFVIWKEGVNGPITDGPEVEGKYTVRYYYDRMRGENAYNQSSNASYGYAPMHAARYAIEVYKQGSGGTMKKVGCSDDFVDPQVWFQRHDLFNSWIKIILKVDE